MLGGYPVRRDVHDCGSLQRDARAHQCQLELIEIDFGRDLGRTAQRAASLQVAGDDALADRELIPQTDRNGSGDRRPIEAGFGVVVIGAGDAQIHSSPGRESRHVCLDLSSCAVERDRGADASDGRALDRDVVCRQRRLPSRLIDRSSHMACEVRAA